MSKKIITILRMIYDGGYKDSSTVNFIYTSTKPKVLFFSTTLFLDNRSTCYKTEWDERSVTARPTIIIGKDKAHAVACKTFHFYKLCTFAHIFTRCIVHVIETWNTCALK